MEYFQHGTLDRYITPALGERDAQTIALQMLEGLKIMHEEQFTHRDLKPQVSRVHLVMNHKTDSIEHIRGAAIASLVGKDWRFWNLEARCKRRYGIANKHRHTQVSCA